MPSLSESFPTLGLLISGTWRIFSKPKKQPVDGFAEPKVELPPEFSTAAGLDDTAELAQIAFQAGVGVPLRDLEEPGDPFLDTPSPLEAVSFRSAVPTSEGLGQDLPSALEESATIPGLYETWVELEERVKRAQNELQAILATREEAAILRGRAQKQLDEGEAIRADAQRIRESAWRAFDRGFAVSAKGLPNRWTTVREIDEAMRTYTALQRATHSESWQEADRTRQRATTELLKALAVLNTAMAQAQRELKEAANLPSVADALMQSAQEELRCAQAIRSELLLLGQEALNELDAAPFSRQPGSQEITISDPQDFAPGILADAGLLGAAPPESAESPRVPPVGIPAEPGAVSPNSSDAISGQASVAWESPIVAEPPATPEPEISAPETPEDVTLRLGGAFETPEPADPPPTAQRDPLPQLSPEVPEAAPPSEWFTEQDPPASPGIPTTETPATETPAAVVPTPTPPPVAPPVDTPPVPAPPVQAQSEAQILDEEIAAATPACALPGSAAVAMAEELARGMGGLGVSAGSGEPPDTTPVEVIQPSPTEAPAPPPEGQGRIIEMPVSPQPNAAEQLCHEMEAASPPTPMPEPVPQPIIPDPFDFRQPATPVIDMPEPRQQPTAAELLRREMQSAVPPPSPEIVEPPVIQAPEQVVPPPAAQAPPHAEPVAVSPAPTESPPPASAPVGAAPAATYTGRIYLMFPSSLSQGRLESVWEVLDQVAGSGNITDTRLVSREAGIQFTLDLGNHELNIEALKNKFPDAQVSAMEEDRIRIDWPDE